MVFFRMVENRLVARMFENRGWSEDYICKIDAAGHSTMKNVEALIDDLDLIRDSNQVITLLCDYDMDGIMSATVGFAGLAELGFNVNLFIPEPQEGYGFRPSTIGALIAQYPNTDVIITGDTGIVCHDGIAAANSYHLDVYVTDHHLADTNKGPVNAKIIVDPMQEDDPYAHPEICGAYVMYQVIKAYADKYSGRETIEQIRRLRVFAGLGTISDTMPLLYENRKLVRDAVSICRMVYANCNSYMVDNIYGCAQYRAAFKGLFSVLKLFAKEGKIRDADDITAEFIAFYVAPMFNSVKRVGRLGDMAHVYGVFFGGDPDADAAYLYNLNNIRKTMVAQYYDELFGKNAAPQPYAPYVYVSSAASGILGLLAQKIMGDTQRPCCVVSVDDGKIHGSGRSPEWYALRSRAQAAFGSNAPFSIAGHQGAFGIKFYSWAGVQAMCDFLAKDEALVKSTLDAKLTSYTPDFVIAHDGTGDTVIDIVLFMEFMEEIKKLEPFGAGFRKPDILLKFHPDEGEWIRMGSMSQHLKVKLPRGFEVVLFNQGEVAAHRYEQDTWYVRGDLGINEFRGIQTVQFMGSFVPPSFVNGGT